MTVNGKWIRWSLVQDPNNFNITESGRTPMTKDLVKRLREEIAVFGCPTKRRNPDGPEAADYIEKLEAALRRISDDGNWGPDGCWDAMSYPDEIARVALGEEEEEDDD